MGPLVAAYAETAGISLRTAQRHAKSSHPDYQRFIGATAAEGVKRKSVEGSMRTEEAAALATVSPMVPSEMLLFFERPDEDLNDVELQVKQSWRLHSETFRLWTQQLHTPGGEMSAFVLARELPKLRENYLRARKDWEDWQVRQRLTITRGEFESFVGAFLLPLSALLKGIPTELATLVNPGDPNFAREQLVGWQRNRAAPQIAAMLDGIDGFVSPA